MISETLGRDGRADAFANHLNNFDDALALSDAGFDAVTDLDRASGLGRGTVQQNPSGTAQIGGDRARRRQTHRPQPDVETYRFDATHRGT